MVKCFECDTELNVPEDPMMGEILTCPSCGADFEIKKINQDGSVEIVDLSIEGEDYGE